MAMFIMLRFLYAFLFLKSIKEDCKKENGEQGRAKYDLQKINTEKAGII
jgi:hypothetical protein